MSTLKIGEAGTVQFPMVNHAVEIGSILEPDVVEAILNSTARDHPCPAEGALSYADEERPAEYFARCEGTETRNGFYGEGIVDASVVISMGVVTS